MLPELIAFIFLVAAVWWVVLEVRDRIRIRRKR